MPTADAPNLNHFWSRLLVEELVRCGIGGFVISPGSRSTPLTLAVAEHPGAPSIMHYDERGAGFYALGRAKALGRPVALVCTSGSAAANYWPAVVESAAGGVPLVLITADRPPELLQCGANQAIDQIRLYGQYARATVELPTPGEQIAPAYLLAAVNDAYHRALSPIPGPVHINCMFREPLAPVADGVDIAAYAAPLEDWRAGGRPFTARPPLHAAPTPGDISAARALLQPGTPGAIVLGELPRGCNLDAIIALANALGWPILPDLSSGLRLGCGEAPCLPYYDAMLLSENFRAAFRPRVVLHLGGRFVSKRLLTHLAALRPAYLHVDASPARQDPNHQATHRIIAAPDRFCEALAKDISPGSQSSAQGEIEVDGMDCAALGAAHEATRTTLAHALCDREEHCEAATAHIIAEMIPEGSTLFAGNSMPVRELDIYATAEGKRCAVCVNRGASGIDGNIATAAGYADAVGREATLFVGDLTLLHDLNSLALLRGKRPPTALVVVNNDGGGIFSFLPIANYPEHFERCFGTPHGMDFEGAARQFGLEYARPKHMDAFRDEYRHALEDECTTVIEVRTSRSRNVALQREVQVRIAAAVDAAL